MSYVPGDVREVKAFLGVQRGDRRRTTGVGPEAGWVDARPLRSGADCLGHGLAQQQPTDGRGEDQVDRVAIVGMALPRVTNPEAVLGLRLAAASKKFDHDRGEVVAADRPFRLRWPEHHTDAVGVRARPANFGHAGIKVDITPRQPKHLRYPPALDEEQRYRRTQPLRCCGGHQRTTLLGSERPALRPRHRGGRTLDPGLVAISSRFTASSMIERSVERVAVTVCADNVLDSSVCHVATCSARKAPSSMSPSRAVIRSTRSSYLPRDDERTRLAATLRSHHRANSPTVVARLGVRPAGVGGAAVANASASASSRRSNVSSRVRPRTRRGRGMPGTRQVAPPGALALAIDRPFTIGRLAVDRERPLGRRHTLALGNPSHAADVAPDRE